ncbi:solute carrier family 31 (copper transporter), member 1 [Geosmithia morbida]|uniref:Copper transport protein n=1 Tax=Geosmithia morbida TaxID=1094350 RepID=A0A9P4YWS0_9HYPO|nr:solute carrier family 31 (copper transporter), member 1 [Geosmithia morbida]KAF4123475.1 solute carrier family 31 (copper transporter), member 1 [Geosmithia morbida]
MDHLGMDHGGMDHGDMDHGHGGHGGMDEDMCNMNVSPQPAAPIRPRDGPSADPPPPPPLPSVHDTGDDAVTETTPFVRPGQNQEDAYNRAHITKGVLYALQNFYGLMLMLVFMTYNAWIMIAVAIGAFAGYVVFGKGSSATKDEVCH